MHKRIGVFLLILAFFALFFAPNISDKFFALFFIGLVPFTDYVLPIPAMLVFYAVLITISIFIMGRLIAIASNPTKRDLMARDKTRKIVTKSTHKQQLPKDTVPKKHYLPATNN